MRWGKTYILTVMIVSTPDFLSFMVSKELIGLFAPPKYTTGELSEFRPRRLLLVAAYEKQMV